MNFLLKPSKIINSLLLQRYVPPISCNPKIVFGRRNLLSTKECEKILLPSSCGVRFISVNKKEDMSQNKKLINLNQALSAFKNVDLKQLRNAPFPAVLYGFGGVFPFIFPPMYFMLGSYSPFLVTTQLMYGATILAFVGGVKWGNAVAKNDVSHLQIGLSTIPSLVAWISILLPEPVGLLLVSTGLFGALYIDLLSSEYPPWFYAIRSSLTAIAILSLLTSTIFYLFK